MLAAGQKREALGRQAQENAGNATVAANSLIGNIKRNAEGSGWAAAKGSDKPVTVDRATHQRAMEKGHGIGQSLAAGTDKHVVAPTRGFISRAGTSAGSTLKSVANNVMSIGRTEKLDPMGSFNKAVGKA